jgi:hypothetical protein
MDEEITIEQVIEVLGIERIKNFKCAKNHLPGFPEGIRRVNKGPKMYNRKKIIEYGKNNDINRQIAELTKMAKKEENSRLKPWRKDAIKESIGSTPRPILTHEIMFLSGGFAPVDERLEYQKRIDDARRSKPETKRIHITEQH